MLRWSELSATSKDVLVVAAYLSVGIVLYWANIFSFLPVENPPPLWVRVGILALLCVCTLWRRRAPVLALGTAALPFTLDLLVGASLPIWLIMTDLVYCVALYGSRRQAVWIVRLSVLLTVVVCTVAFVLTTDWREVVIALGGAAVFLGTPLGWALNIRQHKEIAHSERERAEAMTVIAELDRRAAIDAERSRMARDLHDVVAGHLSAIAIQSEAALRIVAARGCADSPVVSTGSSHGVADHSVADVVSSIRSNSTDALTEMRAMIGLLRNGGEGVDETRSPGRIAELGRLVASAGASGTEVTVSGDFAPGAPSSRSVPAAVDHAAFRIVQEALTNAVVHSPGQPAELDLRCDHGSLRIEVVNALPSTAEASTHTTGHTGAGLTNMTQRAELLGGDLRAGSNGGRWVVEAVLPLSTTPGASTP
ncbi:two-component sensor histidine kinase [Rhodococcus sp. 06-1059B-a]|nr:histidine kinase [Rhodococcus sp. 06-1059B-a]OZD60070.1 two-component sensor histidine kinase [Rhodococcus sp. 06-1059B-a]